MITKCKFDGSNQQSIIIGDTRLINAKMNSTALSDIGRDDNFSYHDYDSYVGLW
jgi:hypothetical protein